MKEYMQTLVLIVVFLAVFIPFASTSPDGLEKVAETMGIEEHEPIWKGLMFDYTVEAVSNPYKSTLISGVFGTVLVLLSSLVLGKAIAKKNNKTIEAKV